MSIVWCGSSVLCENLRCKGSALMYLSFTTLCLHRAPSASSSCCPCCPPWTDDLVCSPGSCASLSSSLLNPSHVPAGGVVHVKHLDDRTLPVQLTEVVYPGYERRIPGEVGAGCRCHAVLETSPLPALTPGCFERHRKGLCNECDLSPCMGGFRLQINHAGQLKIVGQGATLP